MDKNEALEHLKNFKEESGWSYDRIARKMGLHTQTIIGWFQGRHKPSDLALRVIEAFLKAHGLSKRIFRKKKSSLLENK